MLCCVVLCCAAVLLCVVCLSGCPDPSHCAVCNSTGCYEHNSPPCWRCADGQSSTDCPVPENCGFAPVRCDGCMAGMAMPGCPYPQLCAGGAAVAGDECVMSMVFHASSSTCVLLAGWHVSSAVQWLVLALFIAALAGVREFLLVYRQHRARQRRLHQLEARGAAAAAHLPIKSLSPPPPSSSSGPLSLSWPSSPARPYRRSGGGSVSVSVSVSGRDRGGDDLADSSHRSTLLSSDLEASALLASSLSALPGALSWSDVSGACVDSAIYLVSVTLAYVLMLLVMTYNVMLCALVVLLSAAAHLAVNLGFTAWWRRDAQTRAARLIKTERDTAAAGHGYADGDGEGEGRQQQQQQRGGYVAVGAPPVLVEEVRAVSDPCCGQVDDE